MPEERRENPSAFLRLPTARVDPDHQPDRIHLCHDSAPDGSGERMFFPGEPPGAGVPGSDVGGEKVPANKSVEVYFVSVSYLCAIRFFGFSGSALSCL